jgi:hypothetical protein
MVDTTSTGDPGSGATGTTDSTRTDFLGSFVHRLVGDERPLAVEGRLPGFEGATGWLNSEPLTPERLRGRVVLVDFWTYTCINWLRTLPYLRAWDAKYRDLGLTMVGVHTPEFGFERDVDNITVRTAGFGVEYPVAIDSRYGVWRAFANHFWPAVYIADAQGRLRYHHFGEGEYAMTELVVQQLLLEAGKDGIEPDLAMVEPRGFEVAADWRTLRTRETYTGYQQAAGLASLEDLRPDVAHTYTVPPSLDLGQWAPVGRWTMAAHAAVVAEAPARIAFRFQARDVNLVMGPTPTGASIPFRVTLDGEAPGEAHGFDLDDAGDGTLTEQRLHQLIRVPGRIRERTVEIEFLADGAEAYCFTFG